MVTTAQKRGLAARAHLDEAVHWMKRLNSLGARLGACAEVTAMTDVTGFGLLGHLLEVCAGSGVSAQLNYAAVPLLDSARQYAAAYVFPDNTMRNWNSYQDQVDGIGAESLLTLCDPQTSGGLLIAVDEQMQAPFEARLKAWGYPLTPIGQLQARQEKAVYVING
jgi:selenide,water dikinase